MPRSLQPPAGSLRCCRWYRPAPLHPTALLARRVFVSALTARHCHWRRALRLSCRTGGGTLPMGHTLATIAHFGMHHRKRRRIVNLDHAEHPVTAVAGCSDKGSDGCRLNTTARPKLCSHSNAPKRQYVRCLACRAASNTYCTSDRRNACTGNTSPFLGITPCSVMMPVSSGAGVTSKDGFQTCARQRISSITQYTLRLSGPPRVAWKPVETDPYKHTKTWCGSSCQQCETCPAATCMDAGW